MDKTPLLSEFDAGQDIWNPRHWPTFGDDPASVRVR